MRVPQAKRLERKIRLILLCIIAVLTVVVSSAPPATAARSSNVQQEIVDVCLGSRWRFISDPAHPDRPTRLVLVSASSRTAALPVTLAQPVALFAIKVGDRLIVEQDTPLLHSRLKAVAIESATAGQTLRVRLTSGPTPSTAIGPVIHVEAFAPGRARWLTPEWSTR